MKSKNNQKSNVIEGLFLNKNYFIVLLVLCMSACTLDNYKVPDAQFYGSVIDADTFEPIQQDMLDGARIDFVELGFTNPNTRQIRFHTDGTFHENNLFTGTYAIQALRGNFFPTEKDTIEINGAIEHFFVTRPYIRINNVEMTFDEIRGEVTAAFTLDVVAPNPVASVHLIADRNPNLSNTIRTAMVGYNVNAAVPKEQKIKVKMSTENMKSGMEYYFRAAALISGISGAKHNYSAPIKLLIDNSNVIPDLPIPGKVLDACESTDGWGSDGVVSLDTEDKKEGNACVKIEGPKGLIVFQKKFDTPFDTEVTRENGYLAFDLYISDVNLLPSGEQHQFELTSSGGPDVEEAAFYIKDMNLFSGWNKVELNLKNATAVNLKAVNFIRFYHFGWTEHMILKIDNIRFYSK